MSLSPVKRRRIDAIQPIDFETMTSVYNIIKNLNLSQYNYILLDMINGRYNHNLNDIQNILSKYSINDNLPFNNIRCGIDYMQINLNLFQQMYIDYNQEQDVLKLYHKQYNHIIGTYCKNAQTGDKQLTIQSSMYVIFHNSMAYTLYIYSTLVINGL